MRRPATDDPADFIYSIVTGPKARRRSLTVTGALVFGALLMGVILAGRWTDHAFGLPPLLPGRTGRVAGGLLLALGVPLWVWCLLLFGQHNGTPVPSAPPPVLVARGPYRQVRNPMLTAVFVCLFGVGLCLHSLSAVALWIPLFIVLNAIELRTVEEPELVRRFGESYREYRRRTPMFLPRFAARSGPTAPARPSGDA